MATQRTYDPKIQGWRDSTEAEKQALKEWCGLTDEEKEIRIAGLTAHRAEKR